ncbi:hypothetical protein HZ326_10145 [Fusarium oxysporum f. sp. albedinis]|nr:hypothetical protein HZ326_10145 [Fusarium oxysporum f. sp. albedinis]
MFLSNLPKSQSRKTVEGNKSKAFGGQHWMLLDWILGTTCSPESPNWPQPLLRLFRCNALSWSSFEFS